MLLSKAAWEHCKVATLPETNKQQGDYVNEHELLLQPI